MHRGMPPTHDEDARVVYCERASADGGERTFVRFQRRVSCTRREARSWEPNRRQRGTAASAIRKGNRTTRADKLEHSRPVILTHGKTCPLLSDLRHTGPGSARNHMNRMTWPRPPRQDTCPSLGPSMHPLNETRNTARARYANSGAHEVLQGCSTAQPPLKLSPTCAHAPRAPTAN